jgi:hypothetical protein
MQRGRVTAFKSVTVYRHFGEAAVPEGGVQTVPRLCINLYPRLITEEKSRKNLSRGSRKAPN